MTNFHVSIIGAGLGGLSLAQALKKDGVAFDVFERDPAPDSRLQGYRIRIDADGQRALAACLPADLYRLFRESASVASSAGQFLTPQLGPALVQGPESWKTNGLDGAVDDGDLSVHRQTLREILLSGLNPHIHFDHAFDRFSIAGDGCVDVIFENCKSVSSTVLIGADGVNSRVRRQFIPAAEPSETGSFCIYGKTAIPDGTLGNGTNVIFGDGSAAIIDTMRFREPLPDLAARLAPGCRLHPVSDYLYWAVIAPGSRFGLEDAGHDAGRIANLARSVASAINGWHPTLQRIMADSDPADLAMLPVRSGHPEKRWLPGPVTLLGDAIHVMSPAGGLGANTALEDARVLASAIVDTAHGKQPVGSAIAGYETKMRERAERAVAASKRAAALLFSHASENIA
ncbi:FAD-dependent oxidoreductase [Neorhizobium galegae]|uniref:FAD-dependent oxidoreductase n=1 Tax=Neorhizobium galegae TaxID=399 RepID=UPI0021047FFC|nr:NAD(P)/FAD-dependent oxidoreductase [Neorhizobium galegae]MCQ1853061.1 FAD-dependent monooxygenase [Neorhizobium galegae]